MDIIYIERKILRCHVFRQTDHKCHSTNLTSRENMGDPQSFLKALQLSALSEFRCTKGLPVATGMQTRRDHLRLLTQDCLLL